MRTWFQNLRLFDKSALIAFFSVIALSLAAVESGAVTKSNLSPDLSIMTATGLKNDVLDCPVPYSTDYCMQNNSWNRSCEFKNDYISRDLNWSSFLNASMKPYCPLNHSAEIKPTDS